MESALLDTGILLRLLDADDPAHRVVRQAIARLRERQVEFATSFQNVCEFWNVCTRPTSARGGLGLDPDEVERRILIVDRSCRVLFDDATTYSTWRRLLSTHRITGVSVHDAHVAATMIAHNIKTILTLNDRDFQRYRPDGVEAITPAGVLGVE